MAVPDGVSDEAAAQVGWGWGRVQGLGCQPTMDAGKLLTVAQYLSTR